MLIGVTSREGRGASTEIDYLGAALLTGAMTLLILGVLEGGQAWAWNSGWSVGVFGLGVVLLVAFVFVERRAAEPILPLWVLHRRLLVTTSLGRAAASADDHRPQLVRADVLEGVLGTRRSSRDSRSPPSPGLAALRRHSGRLYLRIGFGPAGLIGIGPDLGRHALTLLLGCPAPRSAALALSCAVIGLGMGLVAAPTIIAAQTIVGWAERGVVTAPTCSPARRAARSESPCSARSSTRSSTASGRPDQPQAVIDAGAAVFVAVLVATVLTIVVAVLDAEDPGRRRASWPSRRPTRPSPTRLGSDGSAPRRGSSRRQITPVSPVPAPPGRW